jgi:hypothetical protein
MQATHMPVCQNCGNKLADGAKFCVECGHQQGLLLATPMAPATDNQPKVLQAIFVDSNPLHSAVLPPPPAPAPFTAEERRAATTAEFARRLKSHPACNRGPSSNANCASQQLQPEFLQELAGKMTAAYEEHARGSSIDSFMIESAGWIARNGAEALEKQDVHDAYLAGGTSD